MPEERLELPDTRIMIAPWDSGRVRLSPVSGLFVPVPRSRSPAGWGGFRPRPLSRCYHRGLDGSGWNRQDRRLARRRVSGWVDGQADCSRPRAGRTGMAEQHAVRRRQDEEAAGMDEDLLDALTDLPTVVVLRVPSARTQRGGDPGRVRCRGRFGARSGPRVLGEPARETRADLDSGAEDASTGADRGPVVAILPRSSCHELGTPSRPPRRLWARTSLHRAGRCCLTFPSGETEEAQHARAQSSQ